MELALEAGRLSTLECEQRITAATEWSQLKDVRQRQLADLPLPHTSISRNRLARRRFLMALGACCVALLFMALLSSYKAEELSHDALKLAPPPSQPAPAAP